MPFPVTQYDANAFQRAADFQLQNRLTDLSLQRQGQQDQIAAQDRQNMLARQTAQDQRQAAADAQSLSDHQREVVTKYYAPMARDALEAVKSGKVGSLQQFYSGLLANPQTAAMLKRDIELTPEDLQDPEFDAHIQAIANYGAQPQFQDVNGPRGSIMQRDPVTGQLHQVVGPDNSQPSAAIEKPQLVDVQMPDGTTQKQWVRPGQTSGTAVGAPVPKGAATIKDTTNLRKEFEGMDAVKNYRSVIQLYDRAAKAPNTRAGDISIIYALGKMFDPNSVVREGELVLAQNAAPWLRKVASQANSQLTGKGALSPETRAEIMSALNGQVESMRPAYEQEKSRYSDYATSYGLDPFKIVGNDVANAYKPGGQGPAAKSTGNAPVKVNTPQEAMSLPSGTQFVTPDGRVKVRP